MIEVFKYIDFETGKSRYVFFVGSRKSVNKFTYQLYKWIYRD